ncbi:MULTISPECIES: sulfurtransferase TusA family protein [unclassified Thermotoga]|uniref:sulfurtransferase TusA family protein n=1 Tax=unclassified Thermotoga TaxID=2631113 RepID=UPI000541D5C7|nr:MULTISPECIES: sulfurtransferase TusA family protein [unclassified Thermotoga]KAF2959133.1 ArsR family transcriptional regulator [Thermotoga sp. 38H-to]KHC90869.1 SirA family protein [Thermotoga sp. Mc24]
MGRHGSVSILFKTLSNQTRLDILMLLRDSCLTASEVAGKLNINLSTAYRHLNQMVKVGILKVVKAPEGDRYDFSSVQVFRMLEAAVELLNENERERKKKISSITSIEESSGSKKLLDMRGQICPVPEITTRKELEKLQPGETLIIVCDYPLSGERITSFSLREGYEVATEQIGSVMKIYIKKP